VFQKKSKNWQILTPRQHKNRSIVYFPTLLL
jgi:hypothetical protein